LAEKTNYLKLPSPTWPITFSPIDPLSLDGFEIWNMDQLNHYQFIFAGESHGMINNYDLDLAMIRHLNAIGWLDYYTPEMPYSFCWFINRFLETGEESMLDELFKPFRGHTRLDEGKP
jgi:hypothetical protein